MKQKETENRLKQADDEFGFVTLVRGMIEGEAFWAYAVIKPSLYEEFMALQQEDTSYYLPDYGDVLEYGIGEMNPPEEIQNMMEEKYNLSIISPKGTKA